jgi:RNA polymerase sigma-70 factor (ECF subfamily)
MDVRDTDARWVRLAELLRPVHAQAAGTARRLCRSAADGDDLYQESVIRAFEKLHTLRDESKFRSWFYAILLTRHRSRTRLAFWRRVLRWDDAFAPGEEPVGENGGERGEDAWRARRLAYSLAQLPAVQREALVLFEIEGYSIEDIAAMQAASVPAVKSRLTRGRERLRGVYERFGWQTRRAAREGDAAPDVHDRLDGVHVLMLGAAPARTTGGKEGSHE